MTTVVLEMLDLFPTRIAPTLARASSLSRELLAVVDPDGVLVDVNPAWEATLGWSRDEVLLQPLLDLVHPNDRIQTAEAISGPPGRSFAFTSRTRSRSGGHRWLEWTAVRDADGFLHAAACDVTNLREARALAATVERRLHQTLAQAPIGMALLGQAGEWLQVNDELCRIVGYNEAELLTRRLQDVVRPGDLDPVFELARRAQLGELSAFDLVARAVRDDGSEVPLHIYVSLVRDEWNEPLHFVTQIVDISEQHRYEQELSRLALHDGLTGLLNHRAFHGRLLEEVERARRYGAPLCLALVDFDHFKSVNDAHGHQIGDEVLAGGAHRLRETARTTDPVGRVGGEEFAWLLPETTLADAVVACDRARSAIEEAMWSKDVRATVSIGVVRFDVEESDVDLFRRADEALYDAKTSGRNRVVARGPVA